VLEVVTRYEVRRGQTVAVEDERITGTQTVTFTPGPEGRSTMALALAWQLKSGGPLAAAMDRFFVRRQFADALARTLSRFAREVRVEEELTEGAY
jgi:hypothetical protein